MMLSEFEKLTGLEVTTAEYEKIEAEYMESPDDKAKFCKMWLKKGGLQRLHNARLEEIEHLKKTIEDLEHKLDEEQDWQISHKYGTHYQKTSYDHLTKRCSNGISLSPKRKLPSSSVLSTVSTKIELSLSTTSKSMRQIGME